ncbi:hypothetical protein NE619_10510 [Anaerovorax odorimutans]|uniref:Baseplate structural protein Gp10 C-terminal domain-containing protein n=1 Tax=Anaerovorax odorimutans TaxID=109327 RepID=A0ABT1RPP2_9FIRM|nr:hypothetical protein [Anaerovorax odorimutans]MCQ4637158.1 hypothetical protein [Anaerovorax odorimutans]
MSTKTTNYNLMKLDQADFDKITEFNGNADKIDTALTENRDAQRKHNADKNNPHNVTKEQIGLGNVDNTSDADKPISTAQQNALDKKADLSEDGKIPESQLPSYVDDVLEYSSKADFPAEGEGGKIYVAADTNLTYRWSGTAYVEISPSLALGETASTAYRGDRGKIAYDHSQEPHARADATKTEKSDEMGCVKINGTDVEVVSKIAILDFVYPKGSIMYSTEAEFDPNIAYPGTAWAQIKDVFLLAAGNSYLLGSEGGAPAHVLRSDEMPAHTHGYVSLVGSVFNTAQQSKSIAVSRYGIVSGGKSENVGYAVNEKAGVDGFTIDASHEHSNVGNNQAHNNMPPYIAVNVWQRIA